MNQINLKLLIFMYFLILPISSLRAMNVELEPGTAQLTHELILEGVLHRASPGYEVLEGLNLNKNYEVRGNNDQPWEAEFGQSLLTNFAAQVNKDLGGYVLFEAQGEYADRFWRPININHRAEEEDEVLILREAEAIYGIGNLRIHGFSGIGHKDWQGNGDFFNLYKLDYPIRDYLGNSGSFGMYPDNWRLDMFQNISGRHAPRGVEAVYNNYGIEAAVAYGDELNWGFDESVYARFGIPLWDSRLTFVYKNEDVPHSEDFFEDERNKAYSLTLEKPFPKGEKLTVGVLYNPFRVGRHYDVVRDAPGGTGVLGSSFHVQSKRAKKEDAVAGRIRFDGRSVFWDRYWPWAVDLLRAGVLAGNKNQIDLHLATDISQTFNGKIQYTYRRPVEGPLPFVFEGTPNNIGAVAINPRGFDAPFTVDWDNREASILLSTFRYDPTPGSSFLLYDPQEIYMWNVNPKENSDISYVFQHRLSHYHTTTDRQYYINENGRFVWEPAAHNGALATDHPIHEFRFLSRGKFRNTDWTLGIAGGQKLAKLGLAYSLDPSDSNKPITEYYSIEWRLEWERMAHWGHYGSGVWAPEDFQMFLGESFDRLFGLGVSYKITPRMTWDLAYLGARQDDSLFTAPDLGSYDEFRTLFSYKFGFLFQFK